MFDKEITVINKVKSGSSISYIASTVHGFWSSNEGLNLNGVDLVKSNGVIVRILMSETGYVSPKEYSGTGWTLKKDDYLVKGTIPEGTTIDIKNIIDTYECFKITNVAVKDYGSSDMQHFEVSGE